MFRIAFALLTVLQSQPASPDEVKDALVHAEALYYGAHFNESIALLARVDDALTNQSGRVQEKTDTKVRLALAYIGLNDGTKAKSFFMDVYSLNPGYALDARQFSPKVIAIADEAKAEQKKARCYTAQTEARTYLDNGKPLEFMNLLHASGSECTVLSALAPEAAESLFRTGVAAYKRNEFPSALSSFETAIALAPEHELAREYVDLTRSKIQVADEHRKSLSGLVQNWNSSCAAGDTAAMQSVSRQISELFPDASFAPDIRAKMKPCEAPAKPVVARVAVEPPPEPAKPKINNPGGCIDMQSQLALTRLKTRVDPTVTTELRQYLKNNGEMVVRVKARINESGDVSVTGLNENSNPILGTVVRNAVNQWKFSPIRDASGLRCVDTEIPIVMKFRE
jgi:tetratricopeptide (TPR) repeat protein